MAHPPALRANDVLFCSVTADDVQEIISINTRLQSCDSPTNELVLRLQGLKGLTYSSPLRFLGYFAILEAVLTHSPKPEDRYDSIIRQSRRN